MWWAADFLYDLGIPRTKSIAAGQSIDPNDKVGADGSGPPFFYISGEQPLRYAVNFENLETATAPAQEVVITDQLDPAILDLSTLTFGPVTFGDSLVELPAGGQNVETTVDLRPANDLLVRITATLDEATGVVEWRFVSLDPATGLPPEDPFAGFLPPNVNPPEGDGSVLFTVSPKAGLPTGTQVTNQASIVFDPPSNPAILTPVWLNTINQPRCAPVPGMNCRQPGAGSSTVKLRDDPTDNAKDKFFWKWNKGDATSVLDFRDPVRAFNDYRICVYDSSAEPQPLMETEVFPGDNCSTPSCWRETGATGFKFKDKLGVPRGVSAMTLKSGEAGKSKLLAKGKGENLRLPTLPLTLPVTVQFIVNDGRSRECWETTYTAQSKNEVGKFYAKGP